jgi:hypothetical protein
MSLGVKAGFCVDTVGFSGNKVCFDYFVHTFRPRGFLAFLGGQQRDKPRSEQSED